MFLAYLVSLQSSKGSINLVLKSRMLAWILSLSLHADVEFSAIVDPNTKLAHQRIADLQKGKFAEKWRQTKVFPHYRELLDSPVRF